MRGRYPKSCGENYMQYIMWSGVTNFAVTANSGALHMWFPLLQKPCLCGAGMYLSSRNSHCCSLISLPALALLTTHVAARCPGTPACAVLAFTFRQFSQLTLLPIGPPACAVLASTFLLYSVGLGAGAIPTAGALNWVLKDGLGQLGTLAFGKVIAHNFDIHSKSWQVVGATVVMG